MRRDREAERVILLAGGIFITKRYINNNSNGEDKQMRRIVKHEYKQNLKHSVEVKYELEDSTLSDIFAHNGSHRTKYRWQLSDMKMFDACLRRYGKDVKKISEITGFSLGQTQGRINRLQLQIKNNEIYDEELIGIVGVRRKKGRHVHAEKTMSFVYKTDSGTSKIKTRKDKNRLATTDVDVIEVDDA
jgi:hypothetical protein